MKLQRVTAATNNIAAPHPEQSIAITGQRSDLAMHLTFERMEEENVLDDSGYGNNAKLVNGKVL